MKNQPETKLVASLIYFSSDVEKERVLKWIEKLQQQGHVTGHCTHEYNPDFGEPVWYIP